jgi:hypothetical protein
MTTIGDPDKRRRNGLRELIEGAPSDQRVIDQRALEEALIAAWSRGHTKKQAEIAGKLAAKTKEVAAALAEQRAAMVAAVARARAVRDEVARIKKLVDAFDICALVQIVAHDDFGDEETVDRAIEHKHAIAAALDAIGNGQRVALAALLESPFAGVRASAGAHLLNANLLRERVVPLLQAIERDVVSSAGWTAFWALSPDDHGRWVNEGPEAGAAKP